MAASAWSVISITSEGATRATTAIDGHTLAAAVTASSPSSSSWWGKIGPGLRWALILIVDLVGVGSGELETGRRSLLLGELGSLLRIG
jgi:hypothetical protein